MQIEIETTRKKNTFLLQRPTSRDQVLAN